MSRMIVISNRVAAPTQGGAGSQGGLAVAIAAALKEYRGMWFGWSGERIAEYTGAISIARHDGVTTATIDLEEQDVDEYYNGYANKTLWPLFHYRLDLVEFDRAFGAGYARVNQRFADAVAPLIEPDDLVWIHDYHLIPLARELRARGLKNRIGFFLHTPWPPARLLATLPQHEELVQCLMTYDLIGFQTEDWLDSFRAYILGQVGGSESDGVFTAYGASVRAGVFPIGIDAEAFIAAAHGPEADAAHDRIVHSIAGRKMLVGVDRLDYSKGIEDRFLAYERLLTDHPEWIGRAFLLQIAPPTRAGIGSYQDIRERLDALSGRINGAFADVDWVPLRYVNRAYPRGELAGIYRAATAALVTPLRDGMNLVAKEYVAAQDPDDPGVLILSKFAGAATQMGSALLVNPFDGQDMMEAMDRALTMPLAERKERWTELYDGVRQDDVLAWREHYIAALQETPSQQGPWPSAAAPVQGQPA
ncbi:alpha,alpha-trehalose-phosphate synthase (UDP-forming) [Sandarakinorhabdus sp. DWP1-3-1]|uniref:alpha,alpha-trehalose-phosphate synthase (UDP-forming) n=1 Tax=Sandarakinorhabdus sp. DWP1-3-1 TaxID=2804627 RepID=UPI003CF1E6AB